MNANCLKCRVKHELREIDEDEYVMYCSHLRSMLINYEDHSCDFYDERGDGISKVVNEKVS